MAFFLKSFIQPAESKVKMEPGVLLWATKVTPMGTDCCGEICNTGGKSTEKQKEISVLTIVLQSHLLPWQFFNTIEI